MYVRQRSLLRAVACLLIVSLTVQFCPLQALAAGEETAPSASTAPVREKALDDVQGLMKADLKLLQDQGKEAYLDDLFARLDREKEQVKQLIMAAIEKFGAKKFAMLVMGLGSPILIAVIAAVPAPWVKASIRGALKRFVDRALRTVKRALVLLRPKTLTMGLEGMIKLLGNPSFRAGLTPKRSETDGMSWFEKFFSNPTMVQNFIVLAVALGSTAVAIGLAIAGSTAAPVVAVVGALIALVGLIKKDPNQKDDAPMPKPAQ